MANRPILLAKKSNPRSASGFFRRWLGAAAWLLLLLPCCGGGCDPFRCNGDAAPFSRLNLGHYSRGRLAGQPFISQGERTGILAGFFILYTYLFTRSGRLWFSLFILSQILFILFLFPALSLLFWR